MDRLHFQDLTPLADQRLVGCNLQRIMERPWEGPLRGFYHDICIGPHDHLAREQEHTWKPIADWQRLEGPYRLCWHADDQMTHAGWPPAVEHPLERAWLEAGCPPGIAEGPERPRRCVLGAA